MSERPMCPACDKRPIGVNGIVCLICLNAAGSRYPTKIGGPGEKEIREIIPLVRSGAIDPDADAILCWWVRR